MKRTKAESEDFDKILDNLYNLDKGRSAVVQRVSGNDRATNVTYVDETHHVLPTTESPAFQKELRHLASSTAGVDKGGMMMQQLIGPVASIHI